MPLQAPANWHMERLPDGRVRVSAELTEPQTRQLFGMLRKLEKLFIAQAQLEGLRGLLGDEDSE